MNGGIIQFRGQNAVKRVESYITIQGVGYYLKGGRLVVSLGGKGVAATRDLPTTYGRIRGRDGEGRAGP